MIDQKCSRRVAFINGQVAGELCSCVKCIKVHYIKGCNQGEKRTNKYTQVTCGNCRKMLKI